MQSDDPNLLALGKNLPSLRYALHIPSQTQHQAPLTPGQIEAFTVAAKAIGLHQISRATGYWTLATGQVQQEPLRIAWSDEPIDENALRKVASRILFEAEQEAVAIEVAGSVQIIKK